MITKSKGKKIVCEVRFEKKENEEGKPCPAVFVKCPQCDKEEMSWGNGSTSIKRSCVVLAKNCGCGNFLVCDERDIPFTPSVQPRRSLSSLLKTSSPSGSIEALTYKCKEMLDIIATMKGSSK